MHNACERFCDRGLGTNMMNARLTRSTGFTLIEVLAAMVLMAIALPVTMQALSTSLWAASSARHMTEAAGLAQAKLNELISTGEWDSTGGGDFGAEHPGYRWQTSNAARDYGLTEVTLQITWVERGQDRQLAVATLVDPNLTSATTGVTP